MNSPSTQSGQLYTDFQGLASLKRGADQRTPEAIKAVAEQFEAIFMQMMLKSMRDASPNEGLFQSQSLEQFQDLYDKQLTNSLSSQQHGIGLAEVIERQLGGKDYGDTFSGGETSSPPERTGNLLFQLRKSQNIALVEKTSVSPEVRVETLNTVNINHSTMQVPVTSDMGSESPSRTKINRLQVADGEARVHSMKTKPLFNMTPLEPLRDTISDPEHFDTPQDFINHLYPMAERAGAKLGVEPKTLIAQAALETGWGHYIIRDGEGNNSFNLFNIKSGSSWSGDVVAKKTLEFSKGIPYQEVAPFRAYDGYQQSFDDYVTFLKDSPRYTDALSHAGDSKRYLQELQSAGYATDPDYAKKISLILDREDDLFPVNEAQLQR